MWSFWEEQHAHKMMLPTHKIPSQSCLCSSCQHGARSVRQHTALRLKHFRLAVQLLLQLGDTFLSMAWEGTLHVAPDVVVALSAILQARPLWQSWVGGSLQRPGRDWSSHAICQRKKKKKKGEECVRKRLPNTEKKFFTSQRWQGQMWPK